MEYTTIIDGAKDILTDYVNDTAWEMLREKYSEKEMEELDVTDEHGDLCDELWDKIIAALTRK